MSRAFVKDGGDAPEPRLERAVSAQPNYVTPRGLAMLREGLARAQEARDDRQERYLQGRIDSAILVEGAPHDPGVIEFGATVEVHDARGERLRLRIVGEDEADPRGGSVSWESPIAQALSDHRAGDRVVVRRPAGAIEYTIDVVRYE